MDEQECVFCSMYCIVKQACLFLKDMNWKKAAVL